MLKVLLTIGIIGITLIFLALVTDVRLFNSEPEPVEEVAYADTINNELAVGQEIQEPNAKPSNPKSSDEISSKPKASNKRIITKASNRQLRDSIVSLAKQHLGTPYIYACAIEGKGFDCSGFTYFIFQEFDIDIPRSSGQIAKVGTPIPYNMAAKGDIVVFTGTDKSVREPGHVGIVIENNGDGIKFIHSSSGNDIGVIISEVEGTGYEDRFLQVRRVIKES